MSLQEEKGNRLACIVGRDLMSCLEDKCLQVNNSDDRNDCEIHSDALWFIVELTRGKQAIEKTFLVIDLLKQIDKFLKTIISKQGKWHNNVSFLFFKIDELYIFFKKRCRRVEKDTISEESVFKIIEDYFSHKMEDNDCNLPVEKYIECFKKLKNAFSQEIISNFKYHQYVEELVSKSEYYQPLLTLEHYNTQFIKCLEDIVDKRLEKTIDKTIKNIQKGLCKDKKVLFSTLVETMPHNDSAQGYLRVWRKSGTYVS